MASFWNPCDLDDMVLPPCHYGFQIYINDGTMDLCWQQRSVDIFLGLPYDIAMYGLLLLMLAVGNGYTPGRLIASLGDCHIYNNHHDQVRQQLSRSFRKLPNVTVDFGLNIIEGEEQFLRIPVEDMINISGYDPHPPIKAKLLFFFISVKKLFDNFEIGFTGIQYLSAPLIVLLLLCMPVFIDSTSNFIFGLFFKIISLLIAEISVTSECINLIFNLKQSL